MKNKICTSLEQSKKLIELGIDVSTADMLYNVLGESYVRHDTPIDKYHTPAWSLSALLKLMPKFSLEKDISNNAGYQLYYNYDTTYYDDPIDAAFEMVCWLKENKKL